jgi:hypothetical protein
MLNERFTHEKSCANHSLKTASNYKIKCASYASKITLTMEFVFQRILSTFKIA